MTWCRQAASHYLSQCLPKSMSPYGVTRPQWLTFTCWIVLQNINMYVYSWSLEFGTVRWNCALEATLQHLHNCFHYCWCPRGTKRQALFQYKDTVSSTWIPIIKNTVLWSSYPYIANRHAWKDDFYMEAEPRVSASTWYWPAMPSHPREGMTI